MVVTVIKKRDGKIDRFRREKVSAAIGKAVRQVHAEEGAVEKIMNLVDTGLGRFNGTPPTVNELEMLILESGRQAGFPAVSSAYEAYRNFRREVKDTIKVLSEASGSSTDNSLLIRSDASEIQGKGFDSERIKQQIIEDYNLAEGLAKDIVKRVENMVVELHRGGANVINTTTIREFVEVAIDLEGIGGVRRKHALLGVPSSRVEQLMFSRNRENSNIASNNSEAIREALAEAILKPWALENVFSPEVHDAHMRGDIHVHDLGYPERVYCSAHSLEYLKRFGLNRGVPNLEAKSSPTKSADVLNGHLQTFFASKQTDYAGALGIGFVNILYASLINRPVDVVRGEIDGREVTIEKTDLEKLVGQGIYQTKDEEASGFFKAKEQRKELRELTPRERLQIAQQLIYSASQNAFSRGGQTLFIDFNIHASVPKYMKNVPAVGPSGRYMVQMPNGSIEYIPEAPRFENPENPLDPKNGDADNSKLSGKLRNGKILTYGDFEATAQRFGGDLLDIWRSGDADGRPFHFPKADFHVDDTVFEEYEGPLEPREDNPIPGAKMMFDKALDIARDSGSVYFLFDRGDDAVLAQCCRLKEKIEDPTMLKYPEKLRFTGFQNVTINLARCAYKGKTLEGTLEEIDKTMELALEAHRQKKAHIQKLLDDPTSPLGGAGKPCDDGQPYIDLEKATYIFGLIGMNETIQALTGKQLHESEDAFNLGLEINAHMYKRIKEIGSRAGFKCTIEETPAESTTRRFAKVDWNDPEFGKEARKYIKGTEENPYYTNSVHFASGADVGIVDRIVGQSMFHQMIASGAIVHAWVGEHRPDKEVLRDMIKRTHKKTHCSQFTVSPTYTECDACGSVMRGERELCENDDCSNSNPETVDPATISPVTKIVGYASRIKHWNGSMQQQNEDRKRGQEFYAGLGTPRDMSWLYVPTRDDTGKTQVTIYGKNGCQGCEGAERQIRSRLQSAGLENEVAVRVLHLDEYGRQDLAEAARYDVPLDVFPTVVVTGSNGEQWKKTAKYAPKGAKDARGRPIRSDLVKGDEVLEAVRNIGGYQA